MTTRGAKTIERRLFWIGAWLVAGGSLMTSLFFGIPNGVSFLAGGSLAAVNFVWLRGAVGKLFLSNPQVSKRRVLWSYSVRLLLIPFVLYAMIRFLFLRVPAAVAGFTVFYCSIFVEAILEAFGSNSK